MKRTLFFGILVALLMTSGQNGQLTAQAPVMAVSALTGPAVLDDWGNRFTSFGASVPENPLRTRVRTTAEADYPRSTRRFSEEPSHGAGSRFRTSVTPSPKSADAGMFEVRLQWIGFSAHCCRTIRG